jgi:hypothetical protein|tara:strand:- start:563 stop:1177 length:615 start_codon:yes stop_codon:yes gene_type:complete
MKLKAFLLSLVISVGSFSYAENHVVSPEFQQDFKIAVKKIEDKKFLEAVEIFEKLASQGVPEAQFNLALLNNNGLGTPKNFKMALYWSWYAHLNGHTTALDQVNSIYGSITEALRDTVANLIIEELLSAANTGDHLSALKLGQTYTGLLVTPDYPSAYLWLSIAQAYGIEQASELLAQTAKQLTVEEILSQQEQASSKFLEINP